MKFIILFSVFALTQADVFRPKTFDELTKKFPQFAPKIVGGESATLNQFPYQAALFFDNDVFCGGAIIGAKTILTSASCVEGATSVKVVVGLLRVHDTSPQPNFISANEFNIILEWDSWYKTNNIALIYLPVALQYDDAIQKIGLFEESDKLESTVATISGWGRDSDSSNAVSPVLRFTTAKIISNTECKKTFSADVIKDTNLCLDGKDSKSICNGDFGGPLTIQKNNVAVLAGISSFGSAWGCSIGYPSVYSRISSYADWIKINIRDL